MIRNVFKQLLKLLLLAITFPFALIFVLPTKIRLFEYKNIAICVSIFPTRLGNMIRWWFYKLTLKSLGNKFNIYWLSYIVYPSVEIGNRVTIEEKCIISSCKIGDNVILAANVSIMSGKNHHDIDDLSHTFYDSIGKIKTVILEDNLWIGTHSVIMEDISYGTVVGAGSVVTKKFEPNSILGGVPAKLIRLRGHR
ncbi:MAG: acyltransferase [Mangrovibacterium sp.]